MKGNKIETKYRTTHITTSGKNTAIENNLVF